MTAASARERSAPARITGDDRSVSDSVAPREQRLWRGEPLPVIVGDVGLADAIECSIV